MKKLLSWVLLPLLLLGCTTTASVVPQPPLVLPIPESFPKRALEGGIYEIFLRNFTPEGTLKAAQTQLPRLKTLGIKTLWLMPIHPLGQEKKKGTLGSPYAVRDFYAVDPAYGTPEDLRNFITAAHDQGFLVILDLVASHSAWDNSWVQTHPDWYLQDKEGRVRSPSADWSDVAGFNYESRDLRKEMTNVMAYWVREFDIDGYRCDVAYRMPTDFWTAAIQEIKTLKPLLMLAEGTESRLLDAGFDMLYGSVGYSNLKAVWEGGTPNDFTRAAFDEWTASAGAPVLRFTTNHDETSWSAPPVTLFHSETGARAAAVATFLTPGIPLVYNGQELGSEVKANLFEKTSYDWNRNPASQEFYRRLLTLWRSEPSLVRGSLEVLDLPGEEVLAYTRTSGEDRITVVVNVRNQEVLPSLPDQAWTNLWTGEPYTPGETLPPFGWLILKAR